MRVDGVVAALDDELREDVHSRLLHGADQIGELLLAGLGIVLEQAHVDDEIKFRRAVRHRIHRLDGLADRRVLPERKADHRADPDVGLLQQLRRQRHFCGVHAHGREAVLLRLAAELADGVLLARRLQEGVINALSQF